MRDIITPLMAAFLCLHHIMVGFMW